jgi:7-keto-8-aminopelargonate synthetase-like enzyme
MSLPAPWADRLQHQARQRADLGRDRRIQAPRGVDVASNDYLGLRRDPRLIQAAAEAARIHGAGCGAARLLRGTTPLHEELERELAAWKGLPSALLFNTGYQANATLLPALAGPGDALFSDALNHASLIDGCRLARARGAEVHIYAHGQVADLAARLGEWRARAATGALALVVTDGVFSMDGDAADLPGLLEVCGLHEALLVVDEAHASGLLGPGGAGLAAHQGVRGEVPLVMGTLGKALGSFGAFVAA